MLVGRYYNISYIWVLKTNQMKPPLLIGIDPGINTGMAIKGDKSIELKTVKTHQAFMKIVDLSNDFDITVYCEDARQRKWYGKNAKVKNQGAGAIKVECKIWEDFLKDMLKSGRILNYYMVHPIRGGTKVNELIFRQISGYSGRCSEHARDAYMLIHGK